MRDGWEGSVCVRAECARCLSSSLGAAVHSSHSTDMHLGSQRAGPCLPAAALSPTWSTRASSTKSGRRYVLIPDEICSMFFL